MKKIARYACAVLAAIITVTALAAYDVRMVGVVFDAGAEKFESSDELTADESVMYRFRLKQGQKLHVRLIPDNDHTDFIVYAPGKWPGEVLHDSEATGDFEYSGTVTRTGPHAVSIFQSQDAIADNLTGRYQLLIELTTGR